MLTSKQITDLDAPEKGSKITYDGRDGIAGFGVRVTAAGAKAYILNYRTKGGQERRLTIGDAKVWTLAKARVEAKRLSMLVDQGGDPLGERDAARTAPTVRDLARRAIADHFSKGRTTYDVYGARVDESGDPVGGMLKQWVLPAMGSLKVEAVRAAEIQALHTKITNAGSPVRANRVVALLSKMFSLSIRWEMRTDNPCKNAVDRNPEEKRERYLKPDEIGRLCDALAAHPNQQVANALRLMLLTGARSRSEVFRARWSQFDLEAGTWTKPSSTTKQKKLHHVPLNAPALELLTRIKQEATGPYVFPGRDGHMRDIKNAWVKLQAAAQFEEPTRLHDLRHTVASILVSGGKSLPMIGALLGHSNPATTARYAHLYTDPLREAAELVGAVVTGKPSAEIIPLRKA